MKNNPLLVYKFLRELEQYRVERQRRKRPMWQAILRAKGYLWLEQVAQGS